MEGSKSKVPPYPYDLVRLYCRFDTIGICTGPGKLGNRTIGTAAAGGMLFGTVFGVLIIPGLYYIFGKLAERRGICEE